MTSKKKPNQVNGKEHDDTIYAYMGRACDFTGNDGVKRMVSLQRNRNNSVGFTWETWWDGPDSEPLVTSLSLSMEGLNATLALLSEFHHAPEKFPAPKPVEQV